MHAARTIYDVIATLFTAVTFHELFKVAANITTRISPAFYY